MLPASLILRVGLLLVPLVSAAGIAAHAEAIYQWIDGQGRVIYGDSPPPDREVRRLELLPGPSPADAEAARERADALRRLADEIAAERRRRVAEAAEAAALRQPPPTPELLVWPQREVRYYPWPYDPRRFRGRPPHPGYGPPGIWWPPYPGRPTPPIEEPPVPQPPASRFPPRSPEFTRPWLTPELGR